MYTTTLDFDALAELQKTLGSSPAVFARAVKSGVSSAAFHTKKELQSAVKTNSLGWPEQEIYTGGNDGSFRRKTGFKITQWLQGHLPTTMGPRNTPRRAGKLFGALVNAIRYKYDPTKFSAEVGILREFSGVKAELQARWFQLGQPHKGDPAVTPSMRKYFAAVGMPLSPHTQTLKAPERPLFGPVFNQQVKWINELVFTVVADKLTNGFAHTDTLDKAAGWL